MAQSCAGAHQLAGVALVLRLYDTWASYRLEIGAWRWMLILDYWYLYGEGLKARIARRS